MEYEASLSLANLLFSILAYNPVPTPSLALLPLIKNYSE